MESFVERLLAQEGMLKMGHGQRREDLNLGLGWIYYALARIQRPHCAVVIGSYRGFAPAVIAKGLLDNAGEAALEFIDPSQVDGFWDDAPSVARHFAALGTPNVRHHRCTTQEFVATEAYARLHGIGLLMIDGYHSAEQARFDYLSFLDKLADGAVTLFHDSVNATSSAIYGEDKRYVHTVRLLMERLRRTPGLETFTLPLGDGVTLVRGRPENLTIIQEPF